MFDINALSNFIAIFGDSKTGHRKFLFVQVPQVCVFVKASSPNEGYQLAVLSTDVWFLANCFEVGEIQADLCKTLIRPSFTVNRILVW